MATGDVYKAARLAGHLWRVGDRVTFAYVGGYDGEPVAFTLPRGARAVEDRFRLPPFFAGLLPEGETRRRTLVRALHVAEDDELGLLVQIGADTIGDVQVVPADTVLPAGELGNLVDFATVSFADLWALPARLQDRSSVAGVQPKISHHSRSLIGGRAGMSILKFSPDESWHGVLENEALFMAAARSARLKAPDVEVVADRDGVRALAVARFDRSVAADRLLRHAQEDATQVLGLRPGAKYDPNAREVVGALSEVCAAPAVARRDLLHQLLFSYATGNNDVHAKNLSVGQDPLTRLWSVTPVYDVLHTWPYEGDHRFHPAVRDVAHDTVTRKHWEALADDLGVHRRVTVKVLDQVTAGVGPLLGRLDEDALGMPESWVRDVRRRLRRRLRDLA
ncbi:MAG: type II toxin-antitoxin system HipA family toxin [Egibacteraceae bacterium]